MINNASNINIKEYENIIPGDWLEKIAILTKENTYFNNIIACNTKVFFDLLINLYNDQQKKEKEGAFEATVVSIDGRAAAGKSSLAAFLAGVINGEIIHVDDFFLPLELRTKERLSETGGNVHYERFNDEVIKNIHSKKAFEYGVFECHDIMRINGSRYIKETKYHIVEGSYSHHPKFGDYCDIFVFMTVSPEEQIERITKRNGSENVVNFINRWIPMEEKYFEAYGIKEKSDLCFSF